MPLKESEPLLSAPASQRRRPRPRDRQACCVSLGSLLARRPLTYAEICRPAEEAIAALIAELSALPLGSNDSRTAESLGRLWRAVFSTAPESIGAAGEADDVCVPPVPSPQWKLLGFQGTDPSTDLRAARLSGLLYLTRFVESSAAAAELGRLSADGEMPLAVSAMNVLFMLRCHLSLLPELPPSYCPCCGTGVRDEITRPGLQPFGGRHLRGFALLLLDDPDALYYIYEAALLLAGALWAQRFGDTAKRKGRGGRQGDPGAVNPLHATAQCEGGDIRLMEWPHLLREARQRVMAVLATVPPDVNTLRARLLGSAPDAPAHSDS